MRSDTDYQVSIKIYEGSDIQPYKLGGSVALVGFLIFGQQMVHHQTKVS